MEVENIYGGILSIVNPDMSFILTKDISVIVKLAKNGDEMAMDFLVKFFNKDIRCIVNQYLKNGSYGMLMQEGNIGLWKAVKCYKSNAHKQKVSFRTFAILCIKRQLGRAVKKSYTKKCLFERNATSLDSIICNKENKKNWYDILPKEKYELLDKLFFHEILRKILFEASMSHIEKMSFFYYFCGVPCKEISQILKINEKAVNNAILRAKKKIKKVLSNYL